jgi:hypothetical protein
MDAFSRVYGEAHAGTKQALGYCYGMDGGVTLFAQVEAPKIFSYNLNRYWPLLNYNVSSGSSAMRKQLLEKTDQI